MTRNEGDVALVGGRVAHPRVKTRSYERARANRRVAARLNARAQHRNQERSYNVYSRRRGTAVTGNKYR